MPNYNGVPVTSFVSKVFKKSILLFPIHHSITLPRNLWSDDAPDHQYRGVCARPGSCAWNGPPWVRSCPFLSTRCWENSTRRCCQKKTKTLKIEDWRWMNPGRLTVFDHEKGSSEKVVFTPPPFCRVYVHLRTKAYKSMSSSLESEWGLRFLKENTNFTPIQNEFYPAFKRTFVYRAQTLPSTGFAPGPWEWFISWSSHPLGSLHR